MSKPIVRLALSVILVVGVGGVPLAGPPSTKMVGGALFAGPPPTTMEDPLLEALLLIDERYVTKPQVAQYRGMVGQGLLRITNAIGRSKVRLEDTPEQWTLHCGKHPLSKSFAKPTIISVETVYTVLHEGMALGRICAENAPVPADLVYQVIKGLASVLDSQSYLIEPVKYEQIRSESKEAVTGEVGLELEERNGALVVADVRLGMPADAAGIRTGDRLLRIDEQTAAGLSVGRGEELLRGPIGTNVVLAVDRSGSAEPLTVSLTRQASRFQSVKYQLLRGSVGYVRIVLFHGQTGEDLHTAFERLRTRDMKAMILDLRDNGGGLLNSVVGVAESFIQRGRLIVVVNGRGERHDEHYSRAEAPPFTLPLVVLINQRTASSAEILAGALKDWNRAILVGTKSHGKGSVQAIYPLPDEYALRLTTAYYTTASGKRIENEGVEPDFVVEDKDQQLPKALELLFKNVPGLQDK